MPDLPEYFPEPKKQNPPLKRILLSLLLLLVAFFAVDRLAALALERLVLESEFRFSKLYAGEINADVLVIGDSRGVNAVYAPEFERLTGKKTFNLSYNGLGSMVGSALIQDYLDRNSDPELVIFEITHVLHGYEILKDLKMYAGKSDRLDALLIKQFSFIGWVCKLSHLFRFNGEMFFRAIYYLRKSDQNWINRRVITEESIATLKRNPTLRLSFPEPPAYNVEALAQCIKVLNSRGVQYCLLFSPYLPAYADSFAGRADFIRKMEIELKSRVHVLDFAKAVQDPKFFADVGHMNLEGNKAYMPLLIEAIGIEVGSNSRDD